MVLSKEVPSNMNDNEKEVLHPTIASREVTLHILKAFGIHMSKKLGQNFLIDR